MGLDIYLLSTIYPIISSYNISTDQAVREFLWCEERIYPITYAIWSDKSVLNAQNFIGVQVFILLLRSDIFNRVHIISKGWIPLENGSHSDARKIGIQRQNLILFITTVYDFNGSISMNIEIPAAQVAIFLAFFDASTLKLHWKLSTGNIHLKLVDHSHFGPNFPILIFFPFSIFHRSVPTLCKPKFSMKIIQN